MTKDSPQTLFLTFMSFTVIINMYVGTIIIMYYDASNIRDLQYKQ